MSRSLVEIAAELDALTLFDFDPMKADQDAHRRAKASAGGRPPAFDPQIY